ncbi:hypothetical protein ACWDX6_11080 [Streptomyces sp. NPDC003027]
MTEQQEAVPPAPVLDAPEAPAPVPPAPAPEAPAPVPEASAPAKPARRVLRAVARWTAAVVVCGALGAGMTAGITAMDRTDVPGLATEDDGRWVYPELSLPALPEGAQRPFTSGNVGEIHHADLRRLLLPAPEGATVDAKLNGGGWVGVDQYLAQYGEESRAGLRQALADSALRHIAARAWTMPDGTTTRVFLLQFNSVAFSETFKDDTLEAGATSEVLPDGVAAGVLDTEWESSAGVMDTVAYYFTEDKPHGPQQTRWSYIQAGDTLALVRQDRKGGAPAVPFHQAVVLQQQLLG